MSDLFFGQHAAWYTIPAILGTAFFALRSVLLLIGSHHLGVDFHGDVHVGNATADANADDSTHSFEVLSIQSTAAFIMGFGWAGLAGLKGTHWSPFMVNLIAVLCGVGMVWVLAMMLRAMHQVQTSGTIEIGAAVGREGGVYVTVPGDGCKRGQVRVTVDGRERI